MNQFDKKYYYQTELENALTFEKKLNTLGFKVECGSDLYKIGIKLFDYQEKYANHSLIDKFEDIRPTFIEVMGYINFINKLLPLLDSEHVNKILPHLKLLNNSSILQNAPSKISDQGSNKIFELYMASLCYPYFSCIDLDDPHHSKGDNPDVTFKFKNKKWGIACKVLYSRVSQSIFDNVSKGIEQINRSDVDKGFVILNIKNLVNPDFFWPIVNPDDYKNGAEPEFGCFLNYQMIIEQANLYIIQLRNQLEREIGYANFNNLFQNKKNIKAFAVFMQFGTGIQLQDLPTATSLGFLSLIRYGDVLGEENEMIQILNDNIH